MRVPRIFVEVLDDALHHIVRYNREGACKVLFQMHHRKVDLQLNPFEEFCEDFASGAERRLLVLRKRLSDFDQIAEC